MTNPPPKSRRPRVGGSPRTANAELARLLPTLEPSPPSATPIARAGLTAEQAEQLVTAYCAGASAASLAVRFGISATAVYARLAKAQCPTRLAARQAGPPGTAELNLIEPKAQVGYDGGPDWRTRAACAGQPDPEVFFAADGYSYEAAVQVCKRCPVSSECLAFALDAGVTDGIWGGLTQRQRSRRRRFGAHHQAVS